MWTIAMRLGWVVLVLAVVLPANAADKVYWTADEPHKIQRANLDGSNVEDVIAAGVGNPHGVALDLSRGKIYWTDDATDKIQRANLDGSDIQDLVTTGLHTPYTGRTRVRT
jgi:hypothetical protein